MTTSTRLCWADGENRSFSIAAICSTAMVWKTVEFIGDAAKRDAARVWLECWPLSRVYWRSSHNTITHQMRHVSRARGHCHSASATCISACSTNLIRLPSNLSIRLCQRCINFPFFLTTNCIMTDINGVQMILNANMECIIKNWSTALFFKMFNQNKKYLKK